MSENVKRSQGEQPADPTNKKPPNGAAGYAAPVKFCRICEFACPVGE